MFEKKQKPAKNENLDAKKIVEETEDEEAVETEDEEVTETQDPDADF